MYCVWQVVKTLTIISNNPVYFSSFLRSAVHLDKSCILSNIQHVYYIQLFLSWQLLTFVPVLDAVAMLITAVKRPNCTHISNLKWNKTYIHPAHRLLQITDSRVQQLQAQHAAFNTRFFTLYMTHVPQSCVTLREMHMCELTAVQSAVISWHAFPQINTELLVCTWDHWRKWPWRLMNREHYFISIQW